MTRSAKRFRPAVVAVTKATDKLVDRDSIPIPEREVRLPGQVRRLVLDKRRPTNEEMRLRDALPPPPGYCYTLDGRLVPLEEIQQRIDDPEAQALFCEVLEITGSLRAACDALGVTSMGKVKAYMTRDIQFAEAVEAAADRHRQNLYAHAVQRATVGVQEPIFGGEHGDQIVGYKNVYSDGLLKELLRRHFPEFRGGPQVVVNNPVADAIGKLPDFSKMTAKQREAYAILLEEPPEVIDAEAIEKDANPEDPESDPSPEDN